MELIVGYNTELGLVTIQDGSHMTIMSYDTAKELIEDLKEAMHVIDSYE